MNVEVDAATGRALAGAPRRTDRIGEGGTYSFETRITSASSALKRAEMVRAAGELEDMTVGANLKNEICGSSPRVEQI